VENLFGACNGAMIRLLRQMSRSEVPTRRTPRRVGHPLPWSFMRKTHMGQPPMIRSLPQMSRSVVPTRRTPRRVGHPLPRSFIRKTTWASPRRTGHPHFSFRAKRGTSRLSPGFVCPQVSSVPRFRLSPVSPQCTDLRRFRNSAMASVDFFTVSSPRVFAPDFCQNRA